MDSTKPNDKECMAAENGQNSKETTKNPKSMLAEKILKKYYMSKKQRLQPSRQVDALLLEISSKMHNQHYEVPGESSSCHRRWTINKSLRTTES